MTLERISSGNPKLDEILLGGFPRASINLVIGRPGTGKTILAEQLAFSCGTPDRPALYLTTVSEPLDKVLTFMQNLEFADIDRVNRDILYRPLENELRELGLERLPEHLRELIQEHCPSLVVIDSLKALHDLTPDTKLWRTTLFETARVLTAFDAIAIWVGEYDPGDTAAVEFAIADGIIELRRTQSGTRDERFLRISKLRGSGFADGEHAFTIDSGGLRIYPRLVTPPIPPSYAVDSEALSSGIRGLDGMIDGGWQRGTTTLVAGPSGSGKTLTGLHFLREGARGGEPGLLINFQENPVQLRRSVLSFGWDADDLLRPGRLDQLYVSPVELQVDSIIEEMFARIERDGVRRVVIDALGDLERGAPDIDRFTDYVYTLSQRFAVQGVTALYTLESPLGAPSLASRLNSGISQMCDNLLLLTLELSDDLVRCLRVAKSRASAHDGRRRVLRISQDGLELV